MNNAYFLRIAFVKDGEVVEQMTFRRVVDRSAQGAITKAMHKARVRKGNGSGHGNYGCSEISITVKCLGSVEK